MGYLIGAIILTLIAYLILGATTNLHNPQQLLAAIGCMILANLIPAAIVSTLRSNRH